MEEDENSNSADQGTLTAPPFGMPPDWRADLAGYSWTAQTIGRSSAAVFRLEARGRPTLFVKTELASPFSELPDEAARLRWMAAHRIACANVLKQTREGERDWLLTGMVPGRDLASSHDLPPGRTVEIAADALRNLHLLDVTACPFDHTLDRRIGHARARVEAGIVDEADFDEKRQGCTAADLFDELLLRRPDEEDLVITHGDACLPNLLADGDRFTGFVDCARLGVADRHQDLALAIRSIHYNLGEPWVGPFLQRYGAKADPKRLEFYQLLDEFF